MPVMMIVTHASIRLKAMQVSISSPRQQAGKPSGLLGHVGVQEMVSRTTRAGKDVGRLDGLVGGEGLEVTRNGDGGVGASLLPGRAGLCMVLVEGLLAAVDVLAVQLMGGIVTRLAHEPFNDIEQRQAPGTLLGVRLAEMVDGGLQVGLCVCIGVRKREVYEWQ